MPAYLEDDEGNAVTSRGGKGGIKGAGGRRGIGVGSDIGGCRGGAGSGWKE